MRFGLLLGQGREGPYPTNVRMDEIKAALVGQDWKGITGVS